MICSILGVSTSTTCMEWGNYADVYQGRGQGEGEI